MGVFRDVASTWTYEPFIDEDGTIHIRLGLHGDRGDYATTTATVDDIDRCTRFFGDMGARLDECTRMADVLVKSGAWTLTQRDEYLGERCRQLAARLDITDRQPATRA